MGQEFQVPAAFTGGMAPAFSALNAADDNLADGIGQGYGVIGYKGKVWSLRYRGDRKTIVRPDDGTPSGYIDIVVLGQAKTKSKSFYKAYDQSASDGDRPICASMDGITPDDDVQQKQADHCALCPRNVWKTDPKTGRKGRECTDYKRLAVLLMPAQSKMILNGTPLLEPVFLRVPPDSLNSLAIMGENMAAKGYHYASYVTRVTFDPNKAHPCMVFTPLQGLTAKEAPVIFELRADPTVARITVGDRATLTAIAAPGRTALQPPGTVDTGLSSVAASSRPLESGTVTQTTALQTLDAVQPATVSRGTDPTPDLGLADGAFGVANTVGTSTQQVSPAPVTASDVGEPEDSDADLDAKIAALIASR